MRVTSVEKGEMLNLIPLASGGAIRREATLNAVIVQVTSWGERLVSIECKDQAMLPALQAEAARIIG